MQWLRHIRLQRESPGHCSAIRVHPHGALQRYRHHRWLRRAHRYRLHDARKGNIIEICGHPFLWFY